MMGFIIDDDDILLVAQLTADTPHHLVGCFGEWAVSIVLFEQLFGQFASRHLFAQLESMEIRNDEFCLVQFGQQIRRHNVMLFDNNSAGHWAAAHAGGL
ncbi:MAG: hypothetical protein MZV70_17555 [Desulfobacterales bacterium]|nr:hypothetical protein [Desulfobacterales bacterium]